MRNVNEWGSYCVRVCEKECVISATLAGAHNGCVNVARMRNQKQLSPSSPSFSSAASGWEKRRKLRNIFKITITGKHATALQQQ